MTVRKAPFLNKAYGAYYYRDVPREDEELTHVGPGTPCGEYLRRFWQPVALSRELKDLPLRIRIMGEDLVLFRDPRHRLGLLQLHCSHRGVSLEFGVISERGIRCCYHGWLYDVDGKILETPGEPAHSTLKNRLYHGAYSVHEATDLIFAYMGPPEKMPPFPRYDMFELPGFKVGAIGTRSVPCNWLQVNDNAMDPAHTAFLHTRISGVQFTEAFGDIGELDYVETPLGMAYLDTRRVGDNVWLRMKEYIYPNMTQVSPTFETGKEVHPASKPMITIWQVPVDDTHTRRFVIRRTCEEWKELEKIAATGDGFGQTDERPYEERQRVPGDYDAQMSQRPIAVHALEHLATTDRGVIMIRRSIRQGIRAAQAGKDPKGIVRQEGAVIPTYTHDTVVHLPPAKTAQADKELLRQTGRKIAQDYIGNHPAPSMAKRGRRNGIRIHKAGSIGASRTDSFITLAGKK